MTIHVVLEYNAVLLMRNACVSGGKVKLLLFS